MTLANIVKLVVCYVVLLPLPVNLVNPDIFLLRVNKNVKNVVSFVDHVV